MKAVKSIAACFLVVGAVICLVDRAAATEVSDVLQRAHAWAHFGEGSWRRLRIVTENFDEQGNVTSSSVTDNLTTLEKVTLEAVTLKVEVTVEVAGQKFLAPPQVIQYGYAGETAGQTVSFKPLDDETLTVDGQEIPCQAEQIEILGGGNKLVIEIRFAPGTTPTILKRKTTTSDAASGKIVREIVSEVFALDKPVQLHNEKRERRGYRMRQVLKTAQGTTTTWSDHVPDIPGEVVAHASQKFDNQGRLVRRTTLELVDSDVTEGGIQFRDLPRRVRRQQRRSR